MGKFITFGEIMMRLNPEGYLRFLPTAGNWPCSAPRARLGRRCWQ